MNRNLFNFLILTAVVNAQVIKLENVNDFIVSINNSPSTFIQDETQLFPNSSKDVMYLWKDYRFGVPTVFAQRVDSLGNKIAGNFEIFSDYDVCHAPNGSFLVLKRTDYSSLFPGGWDGYYNIEGKIYVNDNTSYPSFLITWGVLPWCGTGWLGIHHSLAKTENNYLYFHSNGGILSFNKYDFSGNLIYEIPPATILPMDVYDLACAVSKSNDYALFTLRLQPNMNNGNLFGTFFSKNDSISANNILIDSLSFNFISFWKSSIKVITVSDSIYLLYLASQDSLKLYSWKISNDGTQITSQPSLPLFNSGISGVNVYRTISNFAISPLYNNKFSILAIVNESRYPDDMSYNSLFTFSQDGNLIGATYDSTHNFEMVNCLFRTSADEIFVPHSFHGDAYQKRLSGFTTLDSIKLNDDLNGSNEVNPFVHKINDNETFISYSDEVNNLGRKVDFNGNLISDELVIDHRNLSFFPDGSSVAAWYETEGVTYLNRVGFSIYDSDFVLLKKVILTNFQSSNQSINCAVISDTNFVVSFFNFNNLVLQLYSKNGELRKQQLIAVSNTSSPISIFIENQNEFLLSVYGFAQMFDNNLEPISQQFSEYPSYYLGSYKMLLTSYDDYNFLYGQIKNLNGDVLTGKFLMSISRNDFFLNRISNNYFAVLFNYQNKIYVKCFSASGQQIGDSLLIHSNISGFRQSPYFAVNNGKIFFAWSDARIPENGYDIYCSIMNISGLVKVDSKEELLNPSEFVLFQNYPNPFNPSTKISWQSPVSSHQTLKVFDVLGNEVATLVDEYKPAGRYEVDFELSFGIRNLSSGIYMYQLRAGEFIQTKKMIYLK